MEKLFFVTLPEKKNASQRKTRVHRLYVFASSSLEAKLMALDELSFVDVMKDKVAVKDCGDQKTVNLGVRLTSL